MGMWATTENMKWRELFSSYFFDMNGEIYILIFKVWEKGGKLEYFHQLSIGGIPVKSHLENDPDKSITSALKPPYK